MTDVKIVKTPALQRRQPPASTAPASAMANTASTAGFVTEDIQTSMLQSSTNNLFGNMSSIRESIRQRILEVNASIEATLYYLRL